MRVVGEARAGSPKNHMATTTLPRLIWIDLEMSGLNPEKDRVLEVAAIITDARLNILAESEPWVVHHPDSILDGMDSWNSRTHTDSGLIERCRRSTLDEATVEKATLKFLKAHVKPGASPMCGNTICQDRRFLASHMPKLEKFFHYRNFDVSSFKIAAQLLRPELAQRVKDSKPAEHQALLDIRASIDEMRLYLQDLNWL